MTSQVATILYVEDDEGDRFFMQRAFAAAGLGSTLHMVSDGRAAIDYLSGTGSYADRVTHPFPQFVLLDLHLPQLSGFEVLEWIRKQPAYSTLPVVIFSSSSHPQDLAKAKALGATDFLQKPDSGLRYEGTVASIREKWLTPSVAAPAASPPRNLATGLAIAVSLA